MTQRRSFLSSMLAPFRETVPRLPSTLVFHLSIFHFPHELICAFDFIVHYHRYLHQILHSFMSTPPSQSTPALIVLAHKSDLLASTTSSTNIPADQLAINRVRTILERELEKRRQSQTGGMGIESLGGGEGDNTEASGLECSGVGGGVFKFSEWEGGQVTFLGTSALGTGEKVQDEKTGNVGGLESLRQRLGDLY